MSDFNRAYAPSADMSVDAGLRAFMLGVYNKVALGLVVSAALAYLTGTFPPVRDLMFQVRADGRVGMTILGMIVAFAPLGVIMFGITRSATPRSSGIIYWTIVALIGASLGDVVLFYTGTTIATTFLIAATTFGVLSLVGYTTKRDLTGLRSFLIMGVFGLFLALVVNLFVQSGALEFILSAVGVLIFAGLIAANTQQLKMTYYQLGGNATALSVATNFGALRLYINFINLFQFLLMLVGGGGRR